MPPRTAAAALAALNALLTASGASAAELPIFEHRVIDPHCGDVCYAVTLADVDGDSRQDIVAVTENRVLWYRNPDWSKYVIIEDETERDNVCIAPLDIDGDGKVDFALGAGWTKVGTIQWLSRGESLDEQWNVHFIGEERWLHRMRFADVLGTGRPQLVISPLNRTVGEGVRLTAFEIPDDPNTERWPRTLLDNELNRMHNHWHLDLDGDRTADTLTASREGIHLIRKSEDGWNKTRLAAGYPGADGRASAGGGSDDSRQATGAGEVKVGRLDDGRRFVATIEPMHGTSVVVYTRSGSAIDDWQRRVLDDTLQQGHAVWTADFDGDGGDEIVIGHREEGPGPIKGPGLYMFDADNSAGTQWSKHVIDDGGVAVEDAVAADLTGDGRVDIVAGGRATHNIKLYVNQGSSGTVDGR